MKIHVLSADLDYGQLYGPSERPMAFMECIGVQSERAWNPPLLHPVMFRGKNWTLAVDCIQSTYAPGGNSMLMNSLAKEKLHLILSLAGEFLPVNVMSQFGIPNDYAWFNCTTRLEGALAPGSRGKRSDVTGAWEDILHWEFVSEVAQAAPPVFTLANESVGHVYCRDEVAEFIAESGLLGFRVTPVWSSEHGGMNAPLRSFKDMVCPTPDVLAQKRKETKEKRKAAERILAARNPQ